MTGGHHMILGLEPKDAIIFVAGALVTLVVAYVFYKKGLERKFICYAVRFRSLVYRTPKYPAGLMDGLKITFNGNDVTSLSRVTIFVWKFW